jgi:HEAT repeat protein
MQSFGFYGKRKGANQARSNFAKNVEPDAWDAFEAAKKSNDPDTIAKFIGDGNPGMRVAAIDALCGIGTLSPESIEALIRAVSDPVDAVQNLAVKTLCNIGPSARKAIPSLIQKFREPDCPYYYKPIIVLAIGSVGKGMGEDPYVVIPTLLKAIRSEDEAMRIAAATALGMIGDRVAAETLETLAIADQSEAVKDAALKALLQMKK